MILLTTEQIKFSVLGKLHVGLRMVIGYYFILFKPIRKPKKPYSREWEDDFDQPASVNMSKAFLKKWLYDKAYYEC